MESLTLALVLAFASAGFAQAQSTDVKLTRLDCGDMGERDVAWFSDAHTFDGVKKPFVASCYLVQHGNDYLLWDAGFNQGARRDDGTTIVKTSLIDQLTQLGVKPYAVKYVGISHIHGDHTGQASSFPAATLLLGKGDWDKIKAANKADDPLVHWVSGTGKSEPVPADKDVFGDGSVVMLNMPGHTDGHHSLLVKLKANGYVLISGDLAHFHEAYDGNEVPGFNTDRADSLASLDRFKKIAKNLNATVIIQHDPRDIAKLPAFPKAAD
ncbi:N-acyl homoserine lactonase family protein [Asticcacaulis sp. AC402]|uniref:N-acyl homoserine lactonase family protein n=1 Tax=Asticcacaulis sp. AC402 TaxID=1282361 RepID=UPI0004CF23E3|nr:N-acyl homoserine lactonase family protein [Asticcacaulis sp. AC402]